VCQTTNIWAYTLQPRAVFILHKLNYIERH
jgi:hypothetical protein